MYYTRKRKPRYDPRQLSFTFEVMTDHISRIREENAEDAVLPQPVEQGTEQFLSGHLLVGTIPSAVKTVQDPATQDDAAYMEQMLRDGARREIVDAFASYAAKKREQGSTADSKSLRDEFIGTAEWAAAFDKTDVFGEEAATVPQEQDSSARQENVEAVVQAEPYVPLGVNKQGMTVYALRGGGRMVSHDPAIMQAVDGDNYTPEELYRNGKLTFLTVEEVKAWRTKESRSPSPSVKTQQPLLMDQKPYTPERLLAELKAKREKVEQDALRQRRLPVFDARLNEQIANLERQLREENEKEAVSPAEVLGKSEFAQRATEQYAGWKKPEEAKPNVLNFIKEDEPDSKYRYYASDEYPGGYRLIRTLLNPHVGSLGGVHIQRIF